MLTVQTTIVLLNVIPNAKSPIRPMQGLLCVKVIIVVIVNQLKHMIQNVQVHMYRLVDLNVTTLRVIQSVIAVQHV